MVDVVVFVAYSITGVQILYLGILILGQLRKRPIVKTDPPPISVIVCAHDEEQNLKELVPLLLAQDHPDFELIIVEDRCNDGTYDFLLSETKRDSRLKMVRVIQTPQHINEKSML